MWKIIAIFKDVLQELRNDNVGAIAAQTTFFMMVSGIPILILFLFIFQHTALSEYQLLTLITASFPEQVTPFLVSIVHEMYRNSTGALSIALVGALWSSGNGVQVLSNGLNVIYNIEESRQWLVLRIRAIFYTLIFTVSVLLSVLTLVFGDVFRRRILEKYPIVSHAFRVLLNLRYLILFLSLLLLFLIILKFLPNRKASFKSQLPAASAAAFAWVVMSFIISVYVNYFDGFSMYGSMTTIMLILIYIYFGMYILLICAELDSMYQGVLRMWFGRRRQKRKS
ncbi:MAG: YihY/virulence factor BrkB family protein [Lachnospiraceae bacterium]|nr:YihY/virulence factor BrkB family protein [Lachnospiraceae bacterium]